MLVFRRTPHGVRELKHPAIFYRVDYRGRTPHGVRELKQTKSSERNVDVQSHPARGA